MEQKIESGVIIRPKAMRPSGSNITGWQLSITGDVFKCPQKELEGSGADSTDANKSTETYEQKQVNSACPYSLEVLASIGTDEDVQIRERAITEEEMCLRSTPIISIEKFLFNRKGVIKQQRHSFPLMRNSLLVPERPSNPMTRDSTFLLRGINEDKNVQNDVPFCHDFIGSEALGVKSG